MSVAPQQDGFPADPPKVGAAAGPRSELRGRWQVPLLVMALAALGVSVWRLRPPPPPPPPTAPKFEEILAQAVSLKDAGLYLEASNYIESLLGVPNFTDAQKSQLHGLMAQVIFAYESRNSVHGPNNCRRVLEHSDQSLLEGQTFDAETHKMRARAREWLGQLNEAVEEYRQAIAAGVDNPWDIRQHILQLRRLSKDVTPEQLHAELDGFLNDPAVPMPLQFWAAQLKIDLFVQQNRNDLAEKFLTDNLARFGDTPWRYQYTLLRARMMYYNGENDQAERELRSLREQVEAGDPIYADAGWLLGSIMERNGAPELGLSFFDDVLRNTVPSASWAACLLGRAECLAEIERYDVSLQSYDRLVRIALEDPVTAQTDLKGVRESARGFYQVLHLAGKREWALKYLKFAAKLAPATDPELQALYSRPLADLQYEMGEAALQHASQSADPAAERAAGRQYLIDAGDEYLRLAKMNSLDASAVTSAVWQAAESFDLAGERDRVLSVLETFVREYPSDMRVPEALLQLGRAYQSAGELTKAIEKYQQNLIQYPRTPAALASLVPLSICFRDTQQNDKAEQTLLRVLTPRPGDELALITPDAPEYEDALFALGELYMLTAQYEKAIARYEEALERYAKDPRADQATFHLANAYCKSAARIRKDLLDPQNVAFKDGLRTTYEERLNRAHELFGEVIDRYGKRPEESLSDLERLQLRLSYLYNADTVYDLSLVEGATTSEPFARSLSLYEKAAWIYQREPVAMSAYVQIINCYLHMGKVPQAWMALQRARWALRNIPDDSFKRDTPGQNRAYWDNYLNWLEKKPTFASMVASAS